MWFDRPQLVVEGAIDLSLLQNINHLRVQYRKLEAIGISPKE